MEKKVVEKLQDLKVLVEQNLEKFKEIENISNNFGWTNLKLHHVSYYLYDLVNKGLITSSQADSTFNDICTFEYEYFQEWENENLHYVKREYIGRTSSFYYDSNWYGNEIDNGIVEYILEGKSVDLKHIFGSLNSDVYNYLINNDEKSLHEIMRKEFDENDYDDVDDIVEAIEKFFDDEENILIEILDDMETLLTIVKEAEMAYKYISDFKTEENEYSLSYEYLQHDLSEYYSESKADGIFETILYRIDKLNKIQSMDISYDKNTDSKTFEIIVKTNESEFKIDTKISYEHELSEIYIKSIMNFLHDSINKKFELN